MGKCTVVLIVLASFMFFGCNKKITGIAVGQEFTLKYKETAIVEDGEKDVRVVFIKTEDSRCPHGVTCAWEGKLTAVLEIDKKTDIRLSLSPVGPGGSPEVRTGDYTILLTALTEGQGGNEATTVGLKVTK